MKQQTIKPVKNRVSNFLTSEMAKAEVTKLSRDRNRSNQTFDLREAINSLCDEGFNVSVAAFPTCYHRP